LGHLFGLPCWMDEVAIGHQDLRLPFEGALDCASRVHQFLGH
jgi:hypothetical protein